MGPGLARGSWSCLHLPPWQPSAAAPALTMPALPTAALVWYKPGQLDAGANPVLLQVAGADELGDPRASATWRVAGFEDQTAQG